MSEGVWIVGMIDIMYQFAWMFLCWLVGEFAALTYLYITDPEHRNILAEILDEAWP